MKILNRNKRTIKYALYQSKARITNPDGSKGEYVNTYGTVTTTKMYITASKGQADIEMFGTDAKYTKVMITDDMSCPINENTILWVDNLNGTKNDYVVTRVAKSLNYIMYAIRKVEVSA